MIYFDQTRKAGLGDIFKRYNIYPILERVLTRLTRLQKKKSCYSEYLPLAKLIWSLYVFVVEMFFFLRLKDSHKKKFH